MRNPPDNSGGAYDGDLIHQLFERQVARTPSRASVVFRGGPVSYAELNQRADRLAFFLRRRGVGPEVGVAIMADASAELIVGILAVLKAGGAYVPLDPEVPRERLAFIAADADCPILLTQQRLLPRLPDPLRSRAMLLDQPHDRVDPEVVDGLRPDNLAYVMYTSGTTGQPKGVLIEHRHVVYSTRARAAYYHEPVDRFLLMSPAFFDSSVAGLFWTLSQGGTLVLFDQQRDELAKIPSLILQHRISHLLCIPSLWRFVLSHATPQQLSSLRVVIVAGEVCPTDLWKQHTAAVPNAALFNEYGPTEATVWSTVYRVDSRPDCQTVPIGRGIPGTRVYVLDSGGRPLAAGQSGELHVAGPGVARGYLHDDQLTAQRFLPDLLDEPPNQRRYKTGDLARVLPDGNLEFLGRVDRQVKVRGVRVELLEIESLLNRHAAVHESVVIADGAALSGVQLVAYYVPAGGSQPSSQQLRAHLARQLPPYVVPSRFVPLTEMPRTANGKIDYRALAAVGAADATAGPPPKSGQNDASAVNEPGVLAGPKRVLEVELVSIWREMFGGRALGVQDDFFELGGDSLAAADLLSRIQQRLGLTLPVAKLLEVKTIRRLARALRKHQHDQDSSILVPLRAHGRKRPFFCVHPAGGHVLCYRELAEALSREQPFYGLQCPGLFEANRPMRTSVADTARQYLAAIRDVQSRGPYALGGWSQGGMVAYEMAAQLYEQGERVQPLVIFDAAVMYNFALFRALFSQRDTMLLNLFVMTDEQLYEVFCQHTDVVLLPPHADQSLKRRVFEVFANNVRALVDYRPPPYTGPLTLFRASDSLVNMKKYDPAKEWRDVCRSVNVVKVPGNHFEMMRQPWVAELARRLETHLRGAVEAVSQPGRPR